VLSSAAALLDGLFEHPEAIQFPTPCGKRNLILRIHRAYPQPAEVWELCFITWEGRKLQVGKKRGQATFLIDLAGVARGGLTEWCRWELGAAGFEAVHADFQGGDVRFQGLDALVELGK